MLKTLRAFLKVGTETLGFLGRCLTIQHQLENLTAIAFRVLVGLIHIQVVL